MNCGLYVGDSSVDQLCNRLPALHDWHGPPCEVTELDVVCVDAEVAIQRGEEIPGGGSAFGDVFAARVGRADDLAAPQAAAAPAAPKLHAALRGLWHGHLVATRDYATAVKAGNKAAEAKTADAVVANAKQISDAVAGFYGADAGKG